MREVITHRSMMHLIFFLAYCIWNEELYVRSQETQN